MRKTVLLLSACALYGTGLANITLPKIFTANMVLQRDRPVTVWGSSAAGEAVAVTFNGQTQKTKGGKDGAWQVQLAPMKYGGPFTMTLTGKNTIQLNNILIGDVWICSGQSNMEFIVQNTNNAAKEIEAGEHPAIRLFTVQKATAWQPQKDLAGGSWLECNAATLPNFSAVAYFFGRKLNSDMNIPIGLINTSWGGTNIQTWTSWEVMGRDPKYASVNLGQLESDRSAMAQKAEQFKASLKNDKGDTEKWYGAVDMQDWKPMELPVLWEKTEVGEADGNIWFKKEFMAPTAMEGKPVSISLGPVDDDDVTYLNGKKIGSTQGYNIDRVYTADPSVLEKGKNVITVKVTDNAGGGGIYGKPEQLFVEGGGAKLSLAGPWHYKPSALSTQFGVRDNGPNSFPSLLYNAMVAPLTAYAIKGGIWYQGEANTGEAFRYRTLFPDMISDWRRHWGYQFPFLWVQLANFMAPARLPSQSEWAELREAQHKTLSLPQTGEAVIIDIGEAADIHPRNKQDVGHRLALAAEKAAYGKDLVYSGPQYASARTEGNKIIVSFTGTGGGLMAKDKYGYVKGFAIAGGDQKFVWAKAQVEGDKVVVYNEAISNPVAVRYAWADNPDDANLYNKEGLPASPFRTDSWKGKTEN